MFLLVFALLASVFAQDVPFFGLRPEYYSVNVEMSDTGIGEARGGMNVPVFKNDRHAWALLARGQSITLAETISIDGARVPKHFGGGDLGVAGIVDKTHTVTATVGSTGRKIFDNNNSRVVTVNYVFHEEGPWYYFVSYSNNRTRFNNIPLPGFAYQFDWGKTKLIAGFPFIALNWADRNWRLGIFGSPFGASTQATYSIRGPWQASTSVSWSPRAYQNLVPEIDDGRLLFDKKEWATGVTYSPAPPIGLSINYAHHFDRRFFIGRSISDRRSSAVDIDDEGGFQIKARVAF